VVGPASDVAPCGVSSQVDAIPWAVDDVVEAALCRLPGDWFLQRFGGLRALSLVRLGISDLGAADLAKVGREEGPSLRLMHRFCMQHQVYSPGVHHGRRATTGRDLGPMVMVIADRCD
jgi:hypothetical protein